MSFEKQKRWIHRNMLNSILILVSLVTFIYFKLYSTYFMYLGGLKNKFYSMPIVFITILPLILIFYALSLIFLLVYYIINKRQTLSWKKILFSALPLVILLLIIPSMLIGKPSVYYFLNGYEKWVAREVNIPEIRNWLTKLPGDYSEKSYHNPEDYPESFPKAIRNLKPQYMYLSDFEKGRYVEFEWGGGFSHWGVRIGTEKMEIPEESQFERIRPIKPGVYIFERG